MRKLLMANCLRKLVSLFVMMYLAFAPVTSQAVEECDCGKFPFEPTPPCFNICYVGAASKASPESLQKILDIDEELANKISNLEELGILFSPLAELWQNDKLKGSQIQSPDGVELGKLVGYYKSTSNSKIHLAVESKKYDWVVGVPLEGTIPNFDSGQASFRKALVVLPHTPIYFAVDKATYWQPSANIKGIPNWSANQLSIDELETLRQKMEGISSDEFNELVNN